MFSRSKKLVALAKKAALAKQTALAENLNRNTDAPINASSRGLVYSTVDFGLDQSNNAINFRAEHSYNVTGIEAGPIITIPDIENVTVEHQFLEIEQDPNSESSESKTLEHQLSETEPEPFSDDSGEFYHPTQSSENEESYTSESEDENVESVSRPNIGERTSSSSQNMGQSLEEVRTRKRRNEKMWKRNVLKEKRNKGEEYINYAGTTEKNCTKRLTHQKMADLKKMLHYVPPCHHQFYLNLPHLSRRSTAAENEEDVLPNQEGDESE